MTEREREETPPPLPNSYWALPGRLLAGEYPGAPERPDAERKLTALIEAGVSRFVDLTEEHESTMLGRLLPYDEIAREVARSLGKSVEWERHPIVDDWVPDSPDRMSRTLDAIDSALERGETVYVHCLGGVGRTGTVVGCWLVRHGRAGEEALSQIAEWWEGVEKIWRFAESPNASWQREYVQKWDESASATR